MSTIETLPLLLTPETLYSVIESTNLVILDATYYLPTEHKNADTTFLAAHLPTAMRFDLDIIADTTSPFPHMLPLTEQAFEAQLQGLGVTPESWLVLYDQKGLFSSPRAWWMLATFGWKRVSILQGGLPAWLKAGFSVKMGHSTTAITPSNKALKLVFNPEKVSTLKAMMDNVAVPEFTVIDARPTGRFNGTVAEPRAGLKRGHIPNSLNLPFARLVTDEGFLKPIDTLKKQFEQLGIATDDDAATMPVACSCGSGITACVVALALEAIGHMGVVSVYDGAWLEWGSHPSAPVVCDADADADPLKTK